MSEQRIDTGADAATSTDADPGEGMGAAGPSADPRGAAGGDAELPQPTADRPTGAGAADGDTEGESYLRATQAKQGGDQPPGSGRGAASDDASPSRPAGPDGGRGTGPAEAADTRRRVDEPSAGEVTSEPSQRRREADPGSVAEEFGDRAGTAPDDDIAHPSI
jgi:hypothetical protein